MPRTGENIYKRKDGRWEGRYIRERVDGKAKYGTVYARSYMSRKRRWGQRSQQCSCWEGAIISLMWGTAVSM